MLYARIARLNMEFPLDFKPPPNQTEVIDLDSTVNWVFDGVLYIYTKPEIEHTLNNAIEQQKEIVKLVKGKKIPMITDIRMASPLDIETRDYYATAEGTKNATAFAFFVSSTFSMVLANIFIKLQKLHVPTKMFTKKEEALKWLNKYK